MSDIRIKLSSVRVFLAMASCVSAPVLADEVLITTNSTWLYHNDGTLPAANWYATPPGYLDLDWSSGVAPLGYNDPAIASTLSFGTNSNDKWPAYYFRKHFNILNPAAVTGLVAQYIADDGAAFYLNGTLVHLSPNMRLPIGNHSYSVGNAQEPYVWQQFTINPAMLTAGDNVLAIEVHQDDAVSSDVYLDAMLTAVGYATTNEPGGYPADWTAYNDTAWMDGDAMATAFSTNNPFGAPGSLMTDAGQALYYNQVIFGTNGLEGFAFNQFTATDSLVGSAATEFGGMIGTNHFIIWNSNTLSVTLGGLNTSKQYKVVFLCTRGLPSSEPDNFYTNRLTDVVISSVDSFINTSSEGNHSSKFTTSVTDDSIHMQSDVTFGHVARFDQVRPGADGTIIFSLTPNTSLGENRAYLNAFKVVESAVSGGGGDADVDGMDDTWETTYFGSTTAINGGTNEDYDNDGSSNYDEYRAGTTPNSSSSKLEFTSAATNVPGTIIYRWAGVAGKSYSIQQSTNLASSWTVIQSGIPGASPTTVYTGAVSGTKRYLRVQVE